MTRLGMICRMDKSGLGQGQTLRLARLLNPSKIMLIDSTYFNGNEQHPEWYSGYATTLVDGFPSNQHVFELLDGLDIVISCETFYNNALTFLARSKNVETILFANYEFLDYLSPSYIARLPDKMVTPSYWHLKELYARFKAEYLPTPIFEDEFKEAREINLKRTGPRKYLFMNGKTAVHDRNGLESLYAALELAKGDFTVTIKAQHDIAKHPDPRIFYDFSNPESQAELYKDFDALIQPRRYGGQTLSMCEALISGLPVVMTDIEPNNVLLPSEWLVPSAKTGEFMTRTMIDIYSADPKWLATVLDRLDAGPDSKMRALELGQLFEAESLRVKYNHLIEELMR